MSKILIVGGGAAGMMASIYAAMQGHEVHVYEKNEKLGKKIFITGKGRCNVTNACDVEELFRGVVTNGKFLYSAFYGYTNQDCMNFFEELGVPLKIERGNRVFPVSDHSSDIIGALEKKMKREGVQIHLYSGVKKIRVEDQRAVGIELMNGECIAGDDILVTTGGMSYQSTGSTGDGYRFARACGHQVTELIPSLVPLLTRETYVARLQGLSLRNVELSVYDGKKKKYADFGEMLFTRNGITGPLALSASAHLGSLIKNADLTGCIDLKPALSEAQLDARILRDFAEDVNKQFKNVIGRLYPASLVPVMVDLSEIPPGKKIHDITKEERARLVYLTKHFPLTFCGTGEFKEAIITKGGVNVKEVSPATMESKLVSGLYFAGEVLDLDAVTGGYNLQIAWSTAYLAGTNMK